MQNTAGEAGTSSSVMYSYGPPHMAGQKQDDQHEHTFSSYVRIRDVALKTRQRRWTIGKSGERGSGISVLAARHDDYDSKPILLISKQTYLIHSSHQVSVVPGVMVLKGHCTLPRFSELEPYPQILCHTKDTRFVDAVLTLCRGYSQCFTTSLI